MQLETMDKFPYLLVAERGVLPMIDLTIESLESRGNPASIHIVVPGAQLREFARTRCHEHELVAEEQILPRWPLARVASRLPRRPGRAGWYLQQFLKLQFGLEAGCPRYVIWDADTVMLRAPKLLDGGKVLMNASKEYHPPYFRTYERLMGRPASLRHSAIAQYMFVEASVTAALQAAIERRHQREWVDAILASLPQDSNSEFSEYETYANFRESMYGGSVQLVNERWFRHGARVLPDPVGQGLAGIERKFHRYAYVAFERSPATLYKVAGARLLRLCGVSAGP